VQASGWPSAAASSIAPQVSQTATWSHLTDPVTGSAAAWAQY